MSGIEVSNALPASAGRWRGGGGRLRFARTRRGRVGIVIVVVVVGLALFGPFFAPHAPTVFVGEPGSGPTGAAPLERTTWVAMFSAASCGADAASSRCRSPPPQSLSLSASPSALQPGIARGSRTRC